jgi:3-oxoacyl-[acyl-carrier-protein] synthase II
MIVSRRPDGSYGQLLGGAMSHDGHHPTSIAPKHPDVIRCFAEALDNAGVDASEVAYLNAHGPGTRQCDRVEAKIFDEMFSDADGIFSVKPLAGHCQAAAGAVETLASLYSFETGIIPGVPTVAEGHPRLLDGPTPRRDGPVVKSSLGMGGHNAAMVLDAPTAE